MLRCTVDTLGGRHAARELLAKLRDHEVPVFV